MIRILYFASLREALATDSEQLDWTGELSSVAQLRDHLAARGGRWAEALDPARVVLAAVNQEMAAPGQSLRNGDEVAFFPPVTGG
jgi:molybdopterin synthase sulfur carrier subunit